jgi:hypothetical protein
MADSSASRLRVIDSFDAKFRSFPCRRGTSHLSVHSPHAINGQAVKKMRDRCDRATPDAIEPNRRPRVVPAPFGGSRRTEQLSH